MSAVGDQHHTCRDGCPCGGHDGSQPVLASAAPDAALAIAAASFAILWAGWRLWLVAEGR